PPSPCTYGFISPGLPSLLAERLISCFTNLVMTRRCGTKKVPSAESPPPNMMLMLTLLHEYGCGDDRVAMPCASASRWSIIPGAELFKSAFRTAPALQVARKIDVLLLIARN